MSKTTYVYSLKWSPDLRKYDIHGLWPAVDLGNKTPSGWTVEKLLYTTDPVLMRLPEVWNSDMHKTVKEKITEKDERQDQTLIKANLRFWNHEWSKHGVVSGMTPEEYFKCAINLYDKLAKNEGNNLYVDHHHEIRFNLDENLRIIS